MGRVTVAPDTNGTEAAAEAPWSGVDPRVVIARLSDQIAGLVQELAVRDAYIAQLHQALADVAGPPAPA